MGRRNMFPITFTAGRSWTLDVTYRQGPYVGQSVESLLNLPPVDVSGFTAEFKVRKGHVNSPNTVVASGNTLDGRVVLGGASGTVKVIIPASATKIDFGEYNYSLTITDTLGMPKTLLRGILTVLPEA